MHSHTSKLWVCQAHWKNRIYDTWWLHIDYFLYTTELIKYVYNTINSNKYAGKYISKCCRNCSKSKNFIYWNKCYYFNNNHQMMIIIIWINIWWQMKYILTKKLHVHGSRLFRLNTHGVEVRVGELFIFKKKLV